MIPRVAQVMGEMNYGGAEAVVLNYYAAIDRARVQFDFIVEAGSSIPHRERMEAMGARVFVLPSLKQPLAYLKSRCELFQREGYRIVHVHRNALSGPGLLAAKQAGVPVRICHSHSTADPSEGLRAIVKDVMRPFARAFPTHRFACGALAGRWLYGARAMARGGVCILHNAIELDRYAYRDSVRQEVREALGLGAEARVIGHVGRFCHQKNHPFLLSAFASAHRGQQDLRLLLVGEGEGLAAAKQQAQALGIGQSVRFLGPRTDVDRLYAAMDVLVLPSRYEGLPVVGVEAQAAGLPCLFSDHVTREVAVTDRARFLPLDEGVWADAMREYALSGEARASDPAQLRAAGFDIHAEAERLLDFYLKQMRVTGDGKG